MSLVLGIDTSNYKTSVALVDGGGNILSDERRFLAVGKGNRGLRQQEALFQHVNALPELIERAFEAAGRRDVCCVAASERPRPVEGSYMPVFNAGAGTARSIAASLGVPCYMFSHQEMHVEAASYGNEASNWDRFAAFHFSGGTTEALLCTRGDSKAGSRCASPHIDLIGGSMDIAYGQVLDRAGVALGMEFPAGSELDGIALSGSSCAPKTLLPKIKVSDGRINLSGIDTAFARALPGISVTEERDALIRLLFVRIAESMSALIADTCRIADTDKVLLAGGVSSSGFIREWIAGHRTDKNIRIVFADPALSSDNAVGTALLGLKRYGA